MINREKVLQFLLIFCSGAIVSAVLLTLNQRVLPAPIVIEPPPPVPTALPTETPGPIRVFVNGAVKLPAVYELPPNSILQDVISEAGGFDDEANTTAVNLAQPLQDGMQVYVPLLTETAVPPLISEPQSLDSDQPSSTQIVDINHATLEELDELPGIGPSTAQKIVEFRDANGLFLSIDEIMLVSGIGPAKYAQIETLITVEGE
ncbi:MAG: helix-hairpin-helix domain-containing protein [Chloroflexota bacterium]